MELVIRDIETQRVLSTSTIEYSEIPLYSKGNSLILFGSGDKEVKEIVSFLYNPAFGVINIGVTGVCDTSELGFY